MKEPMLAASKLHEGGYSNLGWLAGGLMRSKDNDFSGNEVFRRIRTPECLDRTWSGANFQCMELSDKLALVVSPEERAFDMWVLDEIESSWTHQVKVRSFPRIASDMGNGEYIRITVVGSLKNGELLVTGYNLSGEQKLFSYDI